MTHPLRRTPYLAALLALAVSAVATAAQEGPVHLRLRLEPGQSYRVLSSTEMDITQEMMGQQQESRQLFGMVMLFEVLDVDDAGVATVRSTYESTRVEQDGPMGRMEYDSSDTTQAVPEMMRPYGFLVGQSFTLALAANGSVDRVEGVEDLLSRMLDAMEIPPGPMRDQVEEMLSGPFGSEGIEQSLRHTLGAFPDAPVSVGDTWSDSISATSPVPSTMRLAWTLRERRDGVAHLDVDIGMGSPEGGSIIEMGELVMTYELTGGMSGTMEIEESTGWTVRSRIEGETAGTVTMTGGPMGDLVMPMSMRMVSTSELLSRR